MEVATNVDPMKHSASMGTCRGTLWCNVMKSSVVIVATKLLFNLQTLQAANERHEAELHQKDE
jgi:hypothetical protein